ncbi:MAG TPA: hypothetical protein VFR78_05025 [Pyrinomonadaceae bacterium]|nr:hypothetical protein [Pyrinomonadaceae bacterium]
MIQPNTLAYYNKISGSYKPLKAAHHFKEMKERVAMLWGDEVYVISIDGAEATVSAKGHHLKTRWSIYARLRCFPFTRSIVVRVIQPSSIFLTDAG